MATEQLLSFKKGAFTEGGILPDGRYLFSGASIVEWDYDGKSEKKTVALHISCIPITVDAKGKVTKAGDAKSAYWSIGDPDKIGPNKSGTGIVAKTSTSLSKQSNMYVFIEHADLAGLPEDYYDNDVSVFDDMAVEIANIPAPKREELQKNTLIAANPNAKPIRNDRTIAVIKVIGKMPNEKLWNLTGAAPSATAAPAAAPAKANGKAAAAAAPAGGDDLDLATLLTPIIGSNASISKTSVRVALFKSIPTDDADVKKGIMDQFADSAALEAVLNTIGEGYTINGANIVSIG